MILITLHPITHEHITSISLVSLLHTDLSSPDCMRTRLHTHNKNAPHDCSLKAGIDRLLLGILYMVTYQIGSHVFPHTYLVTPDFRVCMALATSKKERASSYFLLLLTPLPSYSLTAP